jgi:hypothetical protein
MSHELKMNTSKEVFKINKDVLTFIIDKSYYTSQKILQPNKIMVSQEDLSVANLTPNYLALRIKTTKKENYSVNPMYFIISPKGTQEINFKLYLNSGQKPDAKGHKFKFEGFMIKESQKNEDAKFLFTDYIDKGIEVIGNVQKRIVIFKEESELVFDNEDVKEDEKEDKTILRGKNNPLGMSTQSIYDYPDNKLQGSGMLKSIKESYDDIVNIGTSGIFMDKSAILKKENERQEFEKLKKEYNQLKEQVDNLRINEDLLNQRIKIEKNKRTNSDGHSEKFKYKVPEIKEKKYSKNFLIGVFAFCTLIGFYLVK